MLEKRSRKKQETIRYTVSVQYHFSVLLMVKRKDKIVKKKKHPDNRLHRGKWRSQAEAEHTSADCADSNISAAAKSAEDIHSAVSMLAVAIVALTTAQCKVLTQNGYTMSPRR